MEAKRERERDNAKRNLDPRKMTNLTWGTTGGLIPRVFRLLIKSIGNVWPIMFGSVLKGICPSPWEISLPY